MTSPAQGEPEEVEHSDRFAAFRHSSFQRYWLARFFATLSVQIVSVSVGWQIYDLTRDPFDLGLVGLIQFAPSLLLVLVTGSVADRFGRRMIMSISALMEAGCALSLLILTMKGLTSPVPVFFLLFVFGIARAFFAPASSALLANVVPTSEFANAVAWNSSAWQVAAIAGPAIGGLLYGLSAQAAYSIAGVLMLVASGLSLAIPKPPQHSETERPSLQTLFAGFRYIYNEKVVFGAISLDLFAVLLGGAVALLPVYARDILDLGPVGLGMLRSAPGIGAVSVALLLSGAPIKDHAGLIMFVFVGLFGLFTMVFGASTLPWLSIVALALAGGADMVSVYVRETLIQIWTPDRLRGRVNAVNMVFVGASNELGEFRAGTMAALIGTVPAVIFGGVGTVGVAVIWAYLFPQLRKARRLDGRG
ncbi:MAG: MFS transporter [Rhizobiaceae bacterium]